MLSENFRKAALKALEEMSEADIETILLSIGSRKEEKINIATIHKLGQIISEADYFIIRLKWNSKEEMLDLNGADKYCCTKMIRRGFGEWYHYECYRYQEEINPNKETPPKIYRRMELVYEITKHIPDHVYSIELQDLGNQIEYICGEEFVKNVKERKDIMMKSKEAIKEYEDSFKDVYKLSEEERDSLLSDLNEREKEEDTLMKTLYYISNKRGKVVRSIAYEQIMDVHSAFRDLINNESKGGPYCIKKIEVPFCAKDLYQISVHRIRVNDEGRQYLEHMMYTDIMAGRDCVNSHIEELVNNKQDIQFACDTRHINILKVQKEN